VPGGVEDYFDRHPSAALLVIEVAASSLQQDRLSKSRIYAGANVADYWIINLGGACAEVFRQPDPTTRIYATRLVVGRGTRLHLAALPGAEVAVDDLLPARPAR
jgi:Uma2 family endonuclease